MKEFPQFDIASALRKVHMHVCVEREREGGREREFPQFAVASMLRKVNIHMCTESERARERASERERERERERVLVVECRSRPYT